jgi:formylglycine-generating enzyme required for sulfatase activity
MSFCSSFRCLALAALCLLVLGCPRNAKPAVLFAADARLGEAPHTVQFTDMSKGTPRATLKDWTWDFGDGATSTEQNPTHTYDEPGVYTVSLSVKNSRDNSITRANVNFINVLDPEREEGTTPGEVATFAGIEFVWIPGGTFLMGDAAPEHSEPDALPLHEVTISRGFWMSRYEVTQGQWSRVLGERPGFFDALIDSSPIESITWADAQRFVSSLNDKGEGLFRLPTEAEWEYACRAGTDSYWNFGDDESVFGQSGWSFFESPYSPRQTGQLLPNAWGLYDMHGNVEEWVQDYYANGYGSDEPVTDPFGVAGGPFNVTRGGSFIDTPWAATSGTRSPHLTIAIYNFIGTRIVRQ